MKHQAGEPVFGDRADEFLAGKIAGRSKQSAGVAAEETTEKPAPGGNDCSGKELPSVCSGKGSVVLWIIIAVVIVSVFAVLGGKARKMYRNCCG